jgi:AcrR family transcriptional regulator
MRQIAEAAGVSKALLYHYFPNKIELFKAAVQEYAGELQRITEPDAQGTPIEQLSESLDGYLAWIERNAETWAKLMQSATALPEARDAVAGFRAATLENILLRLTGKRSPRPVPHRRRRRQAQRSENAEVLAQKRGAAKAFRPTRTLQAS